MSNDFDTVKCIAHLHENSFSDIETIKDVLNIDSCILKLGLFEQEEIIEIPTDIQALAEQRRQAKVAKDRLLADTLRQQLTDA